MKERKGVLTLAIVVSVLLALVPIVMAQEGGKININRASIDELMNIEGIGQVYAGRIVEYRESHGPFEQIEGIMEVKGIGQKTFDSIKDLITIE